MDIKPLGSTASRRGPAESFTGTVWQNPIIEAPAPARIRGAWVRFEPRARTAWHTHPLGQTLHVVSGIGRVQLWGGPIREIRPGDTVYATVTVKELMPEKCRARLTTVCTVNGEIVIDGDALVMTTSREARKTTSLCMIACFRKRQTRLCCIGSATCSIRP